MLSSRLFRLVRVKRLSIPFLRDFHHEFSQPEKPTKDVDDKESPSEDGLKVKPLKRRTIELPPSPSRKYKVFSDDDSPMILDVDEGRQQTKKVVSEEGQQLPPPAELEVKPLKKRTTEVPPSLSEKYKVFRDDDSPMIFDVEEERQRFQTKDETDETTESDYMGLNLKRGLHGVYDIEDLVDVLRKENAEDIFVCSVPRELKYVDYVVVCSGRSFRHMLAMAEFVRRLFKIKRQKGDVLPKIEGEKSHEWMAMDLGNIALHIFSPKARESYDLESLWAIGAKYDREYNKPQDPLVELFEKHSTLLADAESKEP